MEATTHNKNIVAYGSQNAFYFNFKMLILWQFTMTGLVILRFQILFVDYL